MHNFMFLVYSSFLFSFSFICLFFFFLKFFFTDHMTLWEGHRTINFLFVVSSLYVVLSGADYEGWTKDSGLSRVLFCVPLPRHPFQVFFTKKQ